MPPTKMPSRDPFAPHGRSLVIRTASGRLTPEADRACSTAYVYVCLPNDIAQSAMLDATSQIRQAGLCRFAVKRGIKQAQAAYAQYEKTLRTALSRSAVEAAGWPFWCDLAQAWADRAAPHVLKLRLAIKQALDNDGIRQSELRSWIVLAQTLLRWAVQNFDTYFDCILRQTGYDLRPMFRSARIDNVSRLFFRATAPLLTDPGRTKPGLRLDIDPRCRLAMQCLDTQLLSPDFVNAAGADFIPRDYPEIAQRYADETADSDDRPLFMDKPRRA